MVPQTLCGMWEPCNRVPSHVQYDLNFGKLVTVNDLYGPPYHIWNVEPCHSQ